MLSPDHVQSLADTFRVLGDPTRVRILDALRDGELCVNDLAARIGLSESAVSHQLRLLRTMRLVRARRDGRLAFYAVDDQHILELLAQASTHVQEGA
jgi:ArsR family transcriptional regulator